MTKAILFLCSFIIVAGLACKHTPIQDPAVIIMPTLLPPDTSSENEILCNPDTVYFKNDILPMLISGCTMSGCHDESSHAEGVILTNYDKIMQTGGIKPGNSSKSDLYEAITENDADKIMPRPPYSPLTAEQILKVKKWIDQGAKNNYCSDCDTTSEIKFATHIAPLLQLNCTGCHSTANAGGGYDLTQFTTVQSIALNSKLMGTINHSIGFAAMPKNAAKLSVCNIVKVEKWIQNGALNN